MLHLTIKLTKNSVEVSSFKPASNNSSSCSRHKPFKNLTENTMKFSACVFVAAVYLGLIAAARLPTKYLPPNLSAIDSGGSSQYHHYNAAQRLSSKQSHQYAAAIAAPPQAVGSHVRNTAASQIPILRNEYNNDGNGNYNFGFEAGNGIKRDESAHFQGPWPGRTLKVAGSYSYTGDDGKLYSVNYKADSNGFHAEGDHLPTPPPIPREIQETLHLHQHGNQQQNLAASYASSGGHREFAALNHLIPNANYLPPQQGQGYNFGRHH